VFTFDFCGYLLCETLGLFQHFQGPFRRKVLCDARRDCGVPFFRSLLGVISFFSPAKEKRTAWRESNARHVWVPAVFCCPCDGFDSRLWRFSFFRVSSLFAFFHIFPLQDPAERRQNLPLRSLDLRRRPPKGPQRKRKVHTFILLFFFPRTGEHSFLSLLPSLCFFIHVRRRIYAHLDDFYT